LYLARHGVSKLEGLDINSSGLDHTEKILAEEYPAVEFLSLQVDLSPADSIFHTIPKMIKSFGRIDYAINNAGLGQKLVASGDTSVEEFEKVMHVNFQGLWLCEKYELEQMAKQEMRAVNPLVMSVSSVLGFMVMGLNGHVASWSL
jgi:NAD(P)-dependent dehydrogenase (short-subunit alcohol dehydrogenase family)